jgi:hypothetical protein
MTRLRRHCFSLIEVLTMVALFIPLATVACRLCYQAMLAGRQFSRQATDVQQMALVSREWQAVIHGSDLATWTAGPGDVGPAFQAGDERLVRLDKGRLVFQRPGRRLPVRLPPGTTVTVSVVPGERCAVLTLAWPETIGARTSQATVRLVAGIPATGGTP